MSMTVEEFRAHILKSSNKKTASTASRSTSTPVYQMPVHRPKRRYVVGIDPDKKQSGFAVWDRTLNKFIEFKALWFAELQEACINMDKEQTEFHVEAGWLNKGANKYQAKTRPDDFKKWTRDRQDAYIFERGTAVGINFGAGFAIIHVLQANGYQVKQYRPKTKKWDAALLKQITGITDPTNQDVRDSMRAAYFNR